MRHHRSWSLTPLLRALVLILLGWRGASVSAQSMACVGTLGNSGIAGAELLQVQPTEGPAGLAWSADSTLWISGGDAILHVTADGRLLERYPLEPDLKQVRSWAFAMLEDTLYFFAVAARPTVVQKPSFARSSTVLAALPMQPGATARVVQTFPEIPDHRVGVLAAQPWEGQLLLGQAPQPGAAAPTWSVVAFNPRDGAQRVLFPVEAKSISALAYDAQEQLVLVGGNFGKYIAARNHHPHPCEVVAFDRQGQEQFRGTVIATEAIPSEYRALISLVDDSIWDVAWYGFLARLNRRFEPAPGTLRAWNLELGYPAQVVGAPFPTRRAAALQPVALSTHGSLHVYLGHWEHRTNQLNWTARLGALPQVAAVNLSADGWISVGAQGGQLWWRWDDAPQAAPRFGNNGQAMTSGDFHGEALIAPQLGRKPAEPNKPTPITAVRYEPATARSSAEPDHGKVWPAETPVGLVYLPDTRPNSRRAWIADATGELWHAPIDGRTGFPHSGKFVMVHLPEPLGHLTALTALGDNQLALANTNGQIALLTIAGTEVTQLRILDWSDLPRQERPGLKLQLAGAAAGLWVSDTQRHRVLLLDPVRGTVLGQFGQTDTPGTALSQLNQPGSLAAHGNRAVVYDRLNQRLLKLQWYPPAAP